MAEGSGNALRRPFRRRSRTRSWSSSASFGASGRLRGCLSSPETSSRRRPEHGSGRKGAAGHGRNCGGPLRPPGVTRSTVTRAGAAGSSSGHGSTMDGDEVLAGSTGSRLRRASKGTERGKRTVSSRGSRRGGRRARGRPNCDEFDGGDPRHRRGGRHRGQLYRASRLAWVVEEVNGE